MTSLRELGEFGLIDRLASKIGSGKDVVKGIGDDCAVLDGEDLYTLVTTDMLVSGDHFNRRWQTPKQIGWKSMVANVSDVAAMGGYPVWALVSMALPDDVDLEYMDSLYEGMIAASEKYELTIIGGDTTHGDLLVINIVIIGKVEKENLCLRGDARVGDLICVTGDLGKSWAGLDLLRAGVQGYTEYHLEPSCRLDEGRQLAKHVGAMIDVSDGLASEVLHICEQSGVGAEVHKDKIPISQRTREAAEKIGKDPYFWALSGGEDFELVFTLPRSEIDMIKDVSYTVVGRIIDDGRYLVDGDERSELSGGYDHFRT